jgi:hypothetical protein
MQKPQRGFGLGPTSTPCAVIVPSRCQRTWQAARPPFERLEGVLQAASFPLSAVFRPPMRPALEQLSDVFMSLRCPLSAAIRPAIRPPFVQSAIVSWCLICRWGSQASREIIAASSVRSPQFSPPSGRLAEKSRSAGSTPAYLVASTGRRSTT